MIELNGQNFNQIISENNYIVIDFYASWCHPCKTLTPMLDEISKNTEGCLITKFDIDADQAITEKFGIRNVPTLIFMKEGMEMFRHAGLLSKKDLNTKISNLKGE